MALCLCGKYDLSIIPKASPELSIHFYNKPCLVDEPWEGSDAVKRDPKGKEFLEKQAKRFREAQALWREGQMADPVQNPKHYNAHPSGVECIQITEHMNFCLGNAVKYIWRADLKHDAIEDLKKAIWYLERELKRRGADERSNS